MCDILCDMATNLRFSTAIEVLVLLATEPEKYRTSQTIAQALSTNPVVVRRLLAYLSRGGIIVSAKGPTGGSRLLKGPKQITLRDVYRALGKTNLLQHNTQGPSELEEIGNAIQNVFRKAEKCLERELDSTTLNQVIKRSGRKAVKPGSTVPPREDLYGVPTSSDDRATP